MPDPADSLDNGPVDSKAVLDIDIGVGDAEAPANAIPNVIARLVETETWRNAATVVMAGLLVGLGIWSYKGIAESLAKTRSAGLEALLGTVVKGLDVWAQEHRGAARRWADAPEVVAAASGLAGLALRAADPEAVCASPESAALVHALRPALDFPDVVGFRILDRGGLILATDVGGDCGKRVRSSTFRQRLDAAFDGGATFVRPEPEMDFASGGRDDHRTPVSWFLVPVRDAAGRVPGVLASAVAADGELATVFTAARPGETAEAYAFDEAGVLLTESRFSGQLATLGLVPAGGSGTAVFQARARDPGVDLTDGQKPVVDPDAWPLTQAVALAVSGHGKGAAGERKGALPSPYRSYRGTEVIGVWRWLPAYGIGVVAEIGAEEALSPLRYLVVAFVVIGGFVALSLAAALVSSISLSRLQRQFGRLQRLGAYTLEKEISEGGMATIYLARHALLKRPTAIKVLKKHVATDEFVARFEREVQIASQLVHPNTVEIYDYGRTREGAPYYVMEHLDGVTLSELIEFSGAAPAARVIHILRQTCAALREAHARGMVHRDVKPENIMLCRRGEDDVVKLLDFGLVKSLAGPETRDLTRQLKVLGTPRYMAPERITNPADADVRSDLYAVGALGFLLLTGRHAFEADNDLDISNQVLHAPAPRASAHAVIGVPPELDDLIDACLAKDRAHRPQTAEIMIEVLTRLAARHPWLPHDARLWWQGYRTARADKTARCA